MPELSQAQEDKQKELELQQQQTILLELEMILRTVKDIDKNLVTTIEVLTKSTVHVNSEASGSADGKHLNYNEIIKQNIDNITNILKLLDSI